MKTNITECSPLKSCLLKKLNQEYGVVHGALAMECSSMGTY